MDASYEDEAAPLIFRYGIPRSVRDTREPYQKKLAVFFILACTLFERFAFYSLTTNISLTLIVNTTSSHDWISQHSPTALLNIFSGTSYIATLVFAVLSDWRIGRAKTIIIGFTLYLIGNALITTIASGQTPLCSFKRNDTYGIPIDGTNNCIPSILGTLICTAIGAGAIKSNLVVFGGEQIQESKLTSRYFDKYAVAVNTGSTIATLVIPYLLYKVNNYFISYIVAISMLFMAALLFLIGWKYYIHVKPFETVVTKCVPVMINAFQSRSQYNKNKRLAEKENTAGTSSTLLNASQSLGDDDKSVRIEHHPSTFLDFAKVPNGKFQERIVDEVKSLRAAFVVFSFLIPYWLVYTQKDTSFQTQAEQMRRLDENKYIVSWMSLGDPITIIVGIIILNAFVYKCLDARHRSSSITIKLAIGMGFACLTMCTAGTIEFFRQKQCTNDIHEDFNIYTQLPQNIGMGFSQLFGMVASYEYAYLAAPLSAQSLFMSLHFCSIGIASFIGIAYMSFTTKTSFQLDFSCPVHHGLHEWISYGYYYMLAGVQLIFGIIFVLCQQKFQIIKLNRQQTETNQFLAQTSTSSGARQ